MSDLISVIMSTYNEELEWIEESINSILNQTYKNIEFIIVLDNPKNKELKNLLLRYSEKDRRIKLIFNEKNMGLVKSLNAALEHCNGKYIARMDADDISELDRLALQKKYLEENNLDFVFSGIKIIDENGNELYETNNHILTASKIKKLLKITNVSNHPTWFLKADLYKKLNGYRDVPYCEDYDFSLRCLGMNAKIGKMDKNILKYRIRKNSISKSYSLEQFLNSKSLTKLYRSNKLNNFNELYKLINNNKNLANEAEKEKFKKADLIYNEAIEEIKNKKLHAGLLKFIKSMLLSKYYFVKLSDVFLYKIVKNL